VQPYASLNLTVSVVNNYKNINLVNNSGQ